jgi:hypothetical protein
MTMIDELRSSTHARIKPAPTRTAGRRRGAAHPADSLLCVLALKPDIERVLPRTEEG